MKLMEHHSYKMEIEELCQPQGCKSNHQLNLVFLQICKSKWILVRPMDWSYSNLDQPGEALIKYQCKPIISWVQQTFPKVTRLQCSKILEKFLSHQLIEQVN